MGMSSSRVPEGKPKGSPLLVFYYLFIILGSAHISPISPFGPFVHLCKVGVLDDVLGVHMAVCL